MSRHFKPDFSEDDLPTVITKSRLALSSDEEEVPRVIVKLASSLDYSSDEETKVNTTRKKDTSSHDEDIIKSRNKSGEKPVSDSMKDFYQKSDIKRRENTINAGRRKIITLINTIQGDDTSKLSEEEKKKTMVPTNIPKELLKQIFTMTGPKGMGNFMSLSPLRAKSGMGMTVDLSDIPMSMQELKESNLVTKGITIIGVHLLLPYRDEDVVIPVSLGDNLQKLIVSYEGYKNIIIKQDYFDAISFMKNHLVKIEASMPKLTYFSARSRINLANIDFVCNSPNLEYFELYNCDDEALLDPLKQCTKITCLYILRLASFSLKSIQHLTYLEELIVNNITSYIKDIDLLVNFTNVRHLYMGMDRNNSLDFVSKCKNLETLLLPRHNLVNLNAIDVLPKLTSLYLGRSRSLTDIYGLKYVPDLQVLTILDNPLISIGGMESCSKLEELNIGFSIALFDRPLDFPSVKYINIAPRQEVESKELAKMLTHFPNVAYLVLLLRGEPISLKKLKKYTSLKKVWYNKAKKSNIIYLKENGIELIRKII